MLWNKAIGAGGNEGGSITSISFVASDGTTGSQSVVIPATAQVGDVAFIIGGAVSPTSSAPSGWTLVSQTVGGLFTIRVFYKILTAGDPGSSVIINGSSNISSYGATNVLVFRANKTPTSVLISSLNADGEVSTTVSRLKDTTLYSPPNLIIATKYDFSQSYTSYSSAISGTFWNGGIAKNSSINALASCYEIQPSTNTDRTVSPTNATSSTYQHMHSFVVNLT